LIHPRFEPRRRQLRAFYEDLADLRAVVPAVLLGESQAPATAAAAGTPGAAGEPDAGAGADGVSGGGAGPATARGSDAGGGAAAEAEGGGEGGGAAGGGGGGGGVIAAEDRAAMDAILARLSSCVTRCVARLRPSSPQSTIIAALQNASCKLGPAPQGPPPFCNPR
jgi:hypothetical protein